QERHSVPGDVEITLVNLGHPRQFVQVLDRRTFRVVDYVSVLTEAYARQFFEWCALGIARDLVIKLAPHHEIDCFAVAKRVLRFRRYRRSDKRDLQLRI